MENGKDILTRLHSILFKSVLVLLFIIANAEAVDYDNDNEIDFIWQTPDGEFDHYKVYVSVNGSNYDFVASTTSNTYTVNGSNGYSYRLKVSAVSSEGIEGPFSPESDTVVCDTVSPTKPIISSQYQRDDSIITLTLTSPSFDEHFSNYQLKGGNYADWTDTAQIDLFVFAVNTSVDTVLEIRAKDLAGNIGSADSIIIPRFDDVDNDGLPDAWEILYFGDLSHTAEGDDDTIDGTPAPDGMTNLEEHIAGTDPTDPNSVFALINISRAANTDTITIEWRSVNEKQYTVYYSDFLFGDAMGWIIAEDLIPASGTGTNSWVDDGTKTGSRPNEVPYRYYNVKISGTNVFARDTVGIYKITLRNSLVSEENKISIPFVPYSNNLNDVIGKQGLTGSTISAFADQCWKWNQATLSYERSFLYDDGITKEWRDLYNPADPPPFTFDADSGYRLLLTLITPDMTPLYFVGKVSATSRTINLTKTVYSGLNYVASAYPMEVALEDSGLVESGFTGSTVSAFSDQLWFWNWGTRSYDRIFYNTGLGQWQNKDGTTTTRKLRPGEGFRIVLSPVSGLRTWNYPKPYTQPPN